MFSKKKLFQDIIPKENRSIRNIPIERSSTSAHENHRQKEYTNPEAEVYRRRVNKESPKKGLWFLALVALSAMVFSFLFLFSKADVEISIKKYNFKVNSDLKASLLSSSTLQYATISLTDESTETIEVTGEKELNTFASGTIAVFNRLAVDQQLITGTRFEAPNGLIFKTQSPVTVPKRKGTGKDIVPGSVLVKVKAEKTGANYNVGLSDFTIPFFKGSAKYESIYGRSKTAIGGGSSGKVPIIDPEILSSTLETISNSLENSLLEKVKTQIPENYVLIKGGKSFTKENPTFKTEDGESNVTLKASYKAYILDKTKLATFLSKENGEELISDVPTTINVENLLISLISEEKEVLSFHIEGESEVSYVIDGENIKEVLSGKSENEGSKALLSLPYIEKALIKPWPLWQIPSNLDKISVKID